MTAPITRTKMYWIAGIIVFIIIFIIVLVIAIPSGGTSITGKDALNNGIVGGINFLSSEFGENTTVEDFNKDKLKDILSSKHIRLQIFSTSTSCASQYKDALGVTLDEVDFLSRLLDHLSPLRLAKSSYDVENYQSNGAIASMLMLNGGHCLDNRLSTLRTYYNMGVRIVTLTADGCDTAWAKSANGKGTANKLNDFSKGMIAEMNRLGIMIDIAGLDSDLQVEVVEASEAPVVAVGVGLKAINANPLNLDGDKVVKSLVKKNGLLLLSTDCQLIAQNANNCSINDFTALLREAKTKNIKVGFGGVLKQTSATKVPAELSDANLDAYFNTLFNSGEFSFDFLKSFAKESFMNTLRLVEKIAKELQNKKNITEGFFDWSKLSKDEQACYSYLNLPVTPSPTNPTTSQTTQATTPTTSSTATTPKPKT